MDKNKSSEKKESTVMLTSPWQRLWRLLYSERTILTRIFIIAGFGGLISLSLPLGIQAIINFIQAGRISTSYFILIIFVLAGILGSGYLIIRQQWLIEFFQQRIFARASLEFSLRIPKIHFERTERENTAELMNRFFDVITIQKGLSKLIIDFSTSLLQVFFGLLLLAFYHPLFILFDLVTVVLVIALIRLSMKRGLKTSLRESNWKYKTVQWLEEVATNAEMFRMTPKSKIHLTDTDKYTKHYVEARRSHFKVLVRHYIALLLFKLLVAAGLLILGGLLVIDREIGIGQFVAAEIVILLIINSVEKIIMNLESIYDVLTGLEKIGAVTDLELESKGYVQDVNEADPLILIEQFTLNNDPDLAPLNIEDFKIERGERVFIKYKHPLFVRSMLLSLTGRTHEYVGHVLYKGRSLKSLNLDLMRNNVGEFWGRDALFSASIIDNVKVGRPDITTSQVEQTLHSIGLLKEVRQLINGENTVVMPHSNILSPVIIKGIMLARNVIDSPELLLIDSEQLPSDPVRYKQMLDFLLDRKHPWAVVFFSESEPPGGNFDIFYRHSDGNLQPCSEDELKRGGHA